MANLKLSSLARSVTTGFKIWPLAGEGNPGIETEEKEEPVDTRGYLVEAG